MNTFSFHMGTEIIFGRDSQKRTGEMVKKYGGNKVLLVYGGGSIKRSGLLDDVIASLTERGISYVELSGVQANPRVSLVRKGVEIAKTEGVDFVLGIGGGSCIDTAKAVAVCMVNDGDILDYAVNRKPFDKIAPIGAINTIAAAGSETSTAFVIKNDEAANSYKGGGGGPLSRPLFAIMNPEYTYTLPSFQLAAGASDIFCHTFERYFHNEPCMLGEKFALGLLKTVVTYAPIALANPTDYESHAELMICGSFAHNDVTGIGRGMGMEGTCHGLESTLGGTFDTTHGAGLAIIMPAALERIIAVNEDKRLAVNFATEVFDVENDPNDPTGVALEGAKRLRKWLTDLGMPSKITEMGIPADRIDDIIRISKPSPDNRRTQNGIMGEMTKLDAVAMADFWRTIL